MNKKLKIILSFLAISVVITIIVLKLWEAGVFIFDRSANVRSNYVEWNGKAYSITSGEYTEGRTIAKEKNGDWVIHMDKDMRRLYFAYDNCPVTTNFKGYMGKVNGKWVITTHISEDTKNDDGSSKQYSVSCYVIPNEYWDILSKYFS